MVRTSLPEPSTESSGVERERIRLNDVPILDRPDEKDESDPERLTQTHLEQVSENQRFRPLAAFFGSIRYLHLVPQIVRERRRSGDSRDDPYGSDLLEPDTNRRTRGETAQDPGSPGAVPHFPIRPGERRQLAPERELQSLARA